MRKNARFARNLAFNTLLDMKKIYRSEVIVFDKNFQFLSKTTTSLPKNPSRTPFERSEKQCVVSHVQYELGIG